MNDRKMKNLGRVALFAATFLWGVSFVTMKNVLANISPLYIIAIRFCGAALILFPACIHKLKKIDKSYLVGGLLMGLTVFAAYSLQTFGLNLTTPGKNAFLTSVYCVMVPFLYWVFFRRKPDIFNIVAAFVCIAGIGFITVDGNLGIGTGDALTVVCGFFFAIDIILIARFVENRDPVVLAMLQFAVTGLTALICALAIDKPPSGLTTTDIWSLVFLTVVCTSACILMQVFGQKYTPPSQAAVIMTFESVIGALSSFFLYKEEITVRLIAGFALTFAAVIISETKLKFLTGSQKRRKKS